MEIKLNSNSLTSNTIYQTSDTEGKAISGHEESTLENCSKDGNCEPSYFQKILQWIVDLFKCIFCCCCGSEKTVEDLKREVQTQFDGSIEKENTHDYDCANIKKSIDELIKMRNNPYQGIEPQENAQYIKIMHELPQAVKKEILGIALEYHAFKELSKSKPFTYQEAANSFNAYVKEHQSEMEGWIANNREQTTQIVKPMFLNMHDTSHDVEAILAIYSEKLAARIGAL